MSGGDARSAAGRPLWPRRGVAWTTVVLLSLAYVLSFVDRYILGFLVEPIKADLQLSDVRIGLLLGPAFALFYATIGVPFGWLADRYPRTRIVALGIALWSLATASSGLARGFAGLFGARMAVGVGEAALGPSALSMIGDSFPPERRGRPVAVYAAGLSLGAGLASLLGAALLGWAERTDGLFLPLFGPIRPWQFVFLAIGLPGVLLAAAFLLLPEPPRRTVRAESPGLARTLAHLRRHFTAFGGITMLASVMTTLAYAQGFNPSAFARTYGWDVGRFALVNGLLLVVVGPSTMALVGWLNDAWRVRGRQDAAMRLMAVGFVVMLPASALTLYMPSPALFFAMYGLAAAAQAIVTATALLTLLEITPAQMRGQVLALYYMTISIAGLCLGPTTVGFLSTRVFGEANMRASMGAVPLLYGLVPLCLLPRVVRAYRKLLRDVRTDGS